MTAFLTFLVFALVTQGIALPFVDRDDRRWLLVWMSIAWVCMFLALVAFNQWFPFAGGGDDEHYFALAATPLDSFADVFDLTRFSTVEQPGYPWLLSIVATFVGHDLVALKLFNLACFVLLIPIWYRIGVELGGRRFGRMMAVVILLLTPVWYYWAFLLKDIIIVLLQNLFLLGAIIVSRKAAMRKRSRRARGARVIRPTGWLLILITTVAIIPFRAQLAMMHVALVLGMIGLLSIRRDRQRHIVRTVMVALVLVAGLVKYASDPDWMASVGITSEARVLGTTEFAASLELADQYSTMNRMLFPVLYLITETKGFSPDTWSDFDVTSLGGVLAIPWIVVVCPFSMFGFLWLFGRDASLEPATGRVGIGARLRSSRAITSPWGIVALFIVASMGVSWVAGDTTRWRLSDMPAIAAVAAAGVVSMVPAKRLQVLLAWIAFAGGALLLFYFIRGS